MKTPEQIDNALSFHKPSEPVREIVEAFRTAAKVFANEILKNIPEGRCKSLAQTKLEECSMWAIKGIVLDQPIHIDP